MHFFLVWRCARIRHNNKKWQKKNSPRPSCPTCPPRRPGRTCYCSLWSTVRVRRNRRVLVRHTGTTTAAARPGPLGGAESNMGSKGSAAGAAVPDERPQSSAMLQPGGGGFLLPLAVATVTHRSPKRELEKKIRWKTWVETSLSSTLKN